MPSYPVKDRIKVPDQIPFGGTDPNARFGRHAGDDSANGINTAVFAPASGTITPYTSGQYTGNVVEIFDGQYYPHVFHLSRQIVKPGDTVTEGQLIGYSGNTGLSTGPHVHFGVSKKSVPNTTSFNDYIDPMEYIKKGDTMTPEALNLLAQVAWNTPVNGDDKFVKDYTGKPAADTLKDVLRSKASVDLRTKAANFDNVQRALNTAYEQIEELRKSADPETARKLDEIKKILNT